MAIEVNTLVLGIAQTACYLIGDTKGKHAVVIDPADDARRIKKTADEAGWKIKQILATHAHFDHVLAAGPLRDATGAPFKLHKDDLALLQGMHIQGQLFGLNLSPVADPDGFVGDGDVIKVGAIKLKVLYTPGHSPGHVSYVLADERKVFSGDCLFARSIGRTDLPGGDYETLIRSIYSRLFALDDDFAVMPGHLPGTTIGEERRHNPFLMKL
ncbi:MAG: MBL fold metallo-hydrolase [Anaerolineae bacterium]|nr:MBL fold metallo-hydrolase [Anaerolineae bacterium]